ncbi:MAG: addiction module protein [Acidobacteria bacterium]|nr:addiction module protein [Acidobacteriota bacterium]
MSVVTDVEKLALELSDSDRAKLAEKLIRSLPGPFIEDDDYDGIKEAIRRSREMDENPEMSISMEQLDEMIRKRFPQCVSD